MQLRRRHQVKWRRSYNCRRSEADQVLVTGTAPVTGTGVLRSTDRLLPASTPSTFGKSPVKKGVTFNLDNDDDDDDADDDKTISPPLRDMCRYCTVSCIQKLIFFISATSRLISLALLMCPADTGLDQLLLAASTNRSSAAAPSASGHSQSSAPTCGTSCQRTSLLHRRCQFSDNG